MSLSPPCSCAAPGHCPRTGQDMAASPHLYHLCRTRDDYRALWEATAHGLPPPSPERRPPCRHLGLVLDASLSPCLQAAPHQCALHGRCTPNAPPSAVAGRAVACCALCPQYEARFEPLLMPDWVRRIPAEQLHPRGRSFNNSICAHDGRLLMAYRVGWEDAVIGLCELDAELRPLWNTVLRMPPSPWDLMGQEDPRLFCWRGQLHCAYVGGRLVRNVWEGSQMVCRLSKDHQVEACWRCRYEDNQPTEKNWQFFDWAGELFAVYSIVPHRVLHFFGEAAYPFSQTNGSLPWEGGIPRGGSSPVRCGEEYYSFFHGTHYHPSGRKVYTLGAYTFSAQPPFDIRRMTPGPLLVPNEQDRPNNWPISVVFPCGAVRRGGQWLVSFGHHDHWSCVAAFEAEQVETVLRPTDPPGNSASLPNLSRKTVADASGRHYHHFMFRS
jgi:predicted GH43/DUF377 family glycosyl hydrolase